MDRVKRLALVSIAVGLGVLALKYAAYHITGSVALYSDALESIVNVAAAVAALLAIRLSAKPPDRNHPYGHYKAEYFAAVFEGVLICLAALSIFGKAWLTFREPAVITSPIEGIVINAVATVINAVWCWVLLKQGRRYRSPALVADGQHLLADVFSSAGVAAGLILAVATGWFFLDPILAVLVALNILWMGWRLVRASIGGLMDEAPPAEVLDRIRDLVSRYAAGAIEAHDLRARTSGRVTFIDFHLVVSGEMSVAEAHEICDSIEAELKRELGPAVVSIHVEPEDKAKHSGIVVL